MKRNILKIILCSAFFIVSCSSKKEEQFEKDLDVVNTYVDSLQVFQKNHLYFLQKNISECYGRGFETQLLIEKYNESNKTIVAFFGDLGFASNSEAINTLRKKAILEIKENISTLLNQKEKCFPEKDFKALITSCDSLVKKELPQHTKLAASIARLDLMLLLNEYISQISFSCGKISTHCFWSPFNTVVKIKNYEKNRTSFLELTLPYGKWFSFKSLRRKDSDLNDTLPISKIIYDKNSKERHLVLNLEKLSPGKYSIDAVIRLELPGLGLDSNMYYNNKANKFREYSEPIDFEVFK